jgi:hypothetical protein
MTGLEFYRLKEKESQARETEIKPKSEVATEVAPKNYYFSQKQHCSKNQRCQIIKPTQTNLTMPTNQNQM